MTEIDRRLRELRSELHGLSWRERRRVLAEARDHLLSSLEDGCDEREAVGRLGPGGAFAGFPARRRRVTRGVAVGVPLLLAGLALAPSLDRGLRTPGPTPAQARPKPSLPRAGASIGRCVAAWNAPGNARVRALARRDHVARANVTPTYTVKVTHDKKGQLRFQGAHFAGCGVNLWLGPTLSPYQHLVRIQAKLGRHGLVYANIYRGRTRTAARSANSRVLASGRLAYTGHPLPHEAACPRRVGTAVVGVEALPAGVALGPTGTASLPATPRPRFLMTVRNVGTVAVHGAILSLEVGGLSRPRRPWFRSKPHVLALLRPGETARLVVAPPPLGHGPRYVRANSAAIGCESRVADNTRVFQVVLR